MARLICTFLILAGAAFAQTTQPIVPSDGTLGVEAVPEPKSAIVSRVIPGFRSLTVHVVDAPTTMTYVARAFDGATTRTSQAGTPDANGEVYLPIPKLALEGKAYAVSVRERETGRVFSFGNPVATRDVAELLGDPLLITVMNEHISALPTETQRQNAALLIRRIIRDYHNRRLEAAAAAQVQGKVDEGD